MMNYDVYGFCSNKFLSTNPSLISRLRNALVKGIQEQVLLPKFVVVVVDDDIIKSLSGEQNRNLVDIYNRLINNIMLEHGRLLQVQKEFLPKKSKRSNQPSIIWVEPPLHVNFSNNSARAKFGSALQSSARHHDNVFALKLKKGWDPEENNLYIYENCRFTSEGLVAYWNAVDKTAKFFNTILIKKQQKKEATRQDKFHWTPHNNALPDRRLPRPPPDKRH